MAAVVTRQATFKQFSNTDYKRYFGTRYLKELRLTFRPSPGIGISIVLGDERVDHIPGGNGVNPYQGDGRHPSVSHWTVHATPTPLTLGAIGVGVSGISDLTHLSYESVDMTKMLTNSQ